MSAFADFLDDQQRCPNELPIRKLLWVFLKTLHELGATDWDTLVCCCKDKEKIATIRTKLRNREIDDDTIDAFLESMDEDFQPGVAESYNLQMHHSPTMYGWKNK